MTELRVTTIVGARPQFVKAAAVSRAIARRNGADGCRIVQSIIHTGQHYDRDMSDVFFRELGIPAPAANLGVGSASHGVQTALMLQRLEDLLLAQRPHWVLVYGDTNSTLAAALAAAKLHVPLAHVEAGLRSFDRRMPEEVNRVVADVLSNLLLCPTDAAVENLRLEGITRGVHKVGDVMYDCLLAARAAAGGCDVLGRLGLSKRGYYLATVHRAENTDDPQRLAAILAGLRRLERTVVLPLHPRTRAVLGDAQPGGNIMATGPASYGDMLVLQQHARVVLTDSGGVQKEAFWLGVPCVTLRDSTEWVELVACGCNVLAGADADGIAAAVERFERAGACLPACRPTDLYGDGRSADRILEILASARA
jgi:UDP-N-acetylglucosamine 2-epimerase